MVRRILPVVAASVALLATGCTSSGPGYYVGTNGREVALIRWSPQQDGRVQGTITDDTLSGLAPGQIVNEQTVPVTVRFTGTDVSFSGAGISALAGARMTGRLSGRTLRITAPDGSGYLEAAVLRAGTQAGYDSDLARLQQRVRHDNTAAKRADARQQETSQVTADQQHVSTDVSSLQGDAATLSSDLTQMDTDVQQVSTDLAQLRSDAANGQGSSCDNVTTVDSDATTVDSDGTTVGNDATTITADAGTVRSDISQLTGDLATLLKDHGSVSGNPSPQTVIDQAQADVSNTVTEANFYIDTVNGYLQQAYTITTNLAGTNCGNPG